MDDIDHARRAAAAWGDLAAPPRPTGPGPFELRFSDGRHSALRLYRSGTQTRAALEAVQRLTESLADTGFACPWPHRTKDGDFVHEAEVGAPLAVMEQWIGGTPSWPWVAFDAGTPADPIALFGRVGTLLADLHLTADAVAPADLAHTRPAWDRAALCDPDLPRWGLFWDNPVLDADQSRLLQDARDHAARRLLDIPADETGLIHANCSLGNVVICDDQIYLVNFALSGFGYRLYDLATALVGHQEDPLCDAFTDSLVDGYRTAQGPLPDSAFRGLPLFLMLRAMTDVGRIFRQVSPTDPKLSICGHRAVRLASAFLNFG